jgi:TetR/AcrR family transcriptional repressor of multidrug resistance operon
MAAPTDRAAAVRAALRSLVARNGFHGASMSAVAREAGVGTGTAYTHYASKDELVLAAYCETKAALGQAVTAGLGPDLRADRQFRALWLACYRYSDANPPPPVTCGHRHSQVPAPSGGQSSAWRITAAGSPRW